MTELMDLPELQAARARLADEWRAVNPTSPADIDAFYRTSQYVGDDLDAWHDTPDRQRITDMLLHVAQISEARIVVDIGCGAGHDLRALRDTGQVHELYGVEPNEALAANLQDDDIVVYSQVEDAPIGRADLLICVDVLEHVVDPESYLTKIAGQAKVGAYLFEMTATHDHGTPLHLKSNRAWHPGHCLEQHGWWIVDHADRVRVWQRKAETDTPHASLLACIYRSMSPATHNAILGLLQGNPAIRERVKAGDGLIARSRSIITSDWWTHTSDDVFLMVDDDVTFTPADAERLIALCRDGHDIICGAYPVHNGEHFAILMQPGEENIPILFGAPDAEPIEIRYAATGFMAVHRKVIDALIPTLPLCEPWSFWPLFQAKVVLDQRTGDHTLLSEDWGFCEMARQLGFKVWLDPQAILSHESQIPVSVRNMGQIRDAINRLQSTPAQEDRTNGH